MRRMAAAAVALAGVAVVTFAAVGGASHGAQLRRAAADRHIDPMLDCLAHQLVAVPAGTRVFVPAPDQDDAVYQRLVELATPRFRLVDRPQRAQRLLVLERVGRSRGCDGFAVATPRPGP